MSTKVAILGTGWGTRVQLPAFRAVGLEVAALWGRTPEKAKALAVEEEIPFACSEFANILGRPEVDLVSITTPPSTHAELTVAALEAGKHVLCEKPTAIDAAEVRHMLEVSRLHPEQLCLIDHELRFVPSRWRLRELVGDGYVGEVLHAEATFFVSGRLGSRASWNWWSQRSLGGGILGAGGSHQADALMWTLGRRITSVSARLKTLLPVRADAMGTDHRVDADEYAAVDVELEGGIPGLIHLSAAVAGPSVHRLLVAGSEGSLVYEGEKLFGYRASTREREELTVAEDRELFAGLRDDEWGRGSYYLALALARALDHDDSAALADAASLVDGLRVQAVLDAARRSHEEERRIHVDTD